VQWIAGLELLAGIEVEPVLATLLFGPAVPGDAERLQPAARQRDQVLLKRVDAEAVSDRILVQRAVRAVGADHELVTIAEEGGRDPKMLQLCVREVAEHCCRGCFLHCRGMV
jgi:hypothetical protein